MEIKDREYLNNIRNQFSRTKAEGRWAIYGTGAAFDYLIDQGIIDDTVFLIDEKSGEKSHRGIPVHRLSEIDINISNILICARGSNLGDIYKRISLEIKTNCTVFSLDGKVLSSLYYSKQTKIENYAKAIIEPIARNLFFWIIEKAKEEAFDSVLLGSRDGWLLYCMAKIYMKKNGKKINFEYLHTSRVICGRAGISSIEDYHYAIKRTFKGTDEELLINRFGLNNNEVRKRGHIEERKDWFNSYYSKVIEHSNKTRQNYKNYIQSKCGKHTGFFDFVSTATCQWWIEKILDEEFKLTGLYFLRRLVPGRESIKSYSLHDEYSIYSSIYYYIMENYLILEKVFSSSEPPLLDLEDNGFIFGEEPRQHGEVVIMETIHDIVLDEFRKSLNVYEKTSFNREELHDALVSMMMYSNPFLDYPSLKDDYCNFTVTIE